MYMYECSTKMYLTENKWKKAHSGQYLCCSHATASFLLMTKVLCVAGRRVSLDD